jgi:flagellar basal-body rod protein FlgB
VSIIPISDTATMTLRRALDGLDRRQNVIAANIANLETPGYLARTVSFEDSLRSAASRGRPESAAISLGTSRAATRLNGNNVNIDNETMLGVETSLRQQLVISGLNAKYQMLRTAITGR